MPLDERGCRDARCVVKGDVQFTRWRARPELELNRVSDPGGKLRGVGDDMTIAVVYGHDVGLLMHFYWDLLGVRYRETEADSNA